MGREATCEAVIGRRRLLVKAHLDSTFVRISGDVKAMIPFAEMRGVVARTGALRFRCGLSVLHPFWSLFQAIR